MKIEENPDLIHEAYKFAKLSHEGQKRKYTGGPYITHCLSVASLVSSVGGTSEMIAAALLHDTVEDTDVTVKDIKDRFGVDVATLVCGLTDTSRPEDGNRSARKKIDRDHFKGSLPEIQTIKLADLIDNCSSIVKYDPKFAKIYMKEKADLLEVLKDGDIKLLEKAKKIVDDYYNQEVKNEP